MKSPAISLLVLVIAVLGFLFIHSRTNQSMNANTSLPAKATPVSFTDSDGNEFTMYVAGVVNGTNVVVSNLDFKIGPAHSSSVVRLQTNAVSK